MIEVIEIDSSGNVVQTITASTIEEAEDIRSVLQINGRQSIIKQ